MAGLKVTYYSQNTDKNSSIVGSVGFYVEALDLYLSKMRVIRKRDGGFFIAPPSEKYTDQQGEECYSSFFWFGKKFRDRFQEKAMQAIDAYIAEKASRSAVQSVPDQGKSVKGEEIPF